MCRGGGVRHCKLALVIRVVAIALVSKQKVELEATRALARKVIGASSGQIVFTSGATEGIQTSIVSALLDARSRGLTGPEVLLLYGATEHKAVPEV